MILDNVLTIVNTDREDTLAQDLVLAQYGTTRANNALAFSALYSAIASIGVVRPIHSPGTDADIVYSMNNSVPLMTYGHTIGIQTLFTLQVATDTVDQALSKIDTIHDLLDAGTIPMVITDYVIEFDTELDQYLSAIIVGVTTLPLESQDRPCGFLYPIGANSGVGDTPLPYWDQIVDREFGIVLFGDTPDYQAGRDLIKRLIGTSGSPNPRATNIKLDAVSYDAVTEDTNERIIVYTFSDSVNISELDTGRLIL